VSEILASRLKRSTACLAKETPKLYNTVCKIDCFFSFTLSLLENDLTFNLMILVTQNYNCTKDTMQNDYPKIGNPASLATEWAF
jgi:hypothetical protein